LPIVVALAALAGALACATGGGGADVAADPGAEAADAPAETADEVNDSLSDVVPDAGGETAPEAQEPLAIKVVQFNTGTSGTFDPNAPADGYTEALAKVTDEWYGNGLAWVPGVEAARKFLAEQAPDIMTFQEIFHSGDCVDVPAEAKPHFVCETWKAGDPTVAQVIAGAGYQVACHWGKDDKCAAVRKSFGTFRGCDADFCLEGLWGSTVDGCGKGARVGRGVIDLVAGGELTLASIHASSGIAASDGECRVKQLRQVFEDLGDGKPAASGARNVIMGDFNTDPARLVEADPSAAYLAEHVGDGKAFHFVNDAGPDATPTYAGLFTIDHVISDSGTGSCWTAGVTEGHPPVTEAIYFDHHPLVCDVTIPPAP
jgi:hypothetical protein